MQQRISFQNSKGGNLVGILSSPSGTASIPVVVLCHGLDSNKGTAVCLWLERLLNEKGLATLRFDFFGHGESEGRFEDITISEAVDDALQAIAFVKSRGFSKIGLFGSSFGGMAALLAASKSPGLQLLALKSPVSGCLGRIAAEEGGVDAGRWKKQGFTWHETRSGKAKLNYSFFEDAEKASGFEEAGKILVPTLVVHGSEDNVVPAEQSRKTASIIPNCRLEVIEGADHRYSKPEHFKKMLKTVSEFFAWGA